MDCSHPETARAWALAWVREASPGRARWHLTMAIRDMERSGYSPTDHRYNSPSEVQRRAGIEAIRAVLATVPAGE